MSNAPSAGTVVAIVPCNDLDASERFYNRLGFVRRMRSGNPDYRILSNSAGDTSICRARKKAGWYRAETHSDSTYILKMSTAWRLPYRIYVPEDADQRTSPGECTNLRFPIRMRRLFASVGLVASDKNAKVAVEQLRCACADPAISSMSVMTADIGGQTGWRRTCPRSRR
jgi:catechol 2,3-dioxygenase-like lactoylglutathione lyase family enzyme